MNCSPSPFYSSIAAHYDELRHFAPTVGAEYLGRKWSIPPEQVIAIWRACRRKQRRAA